MDDRLNKGKFNTNRIRSLLTFFYGEMKPELIISPSHGDISYLSKIISKFLNDSIKKIPKNSGIKKFIFQLDNEIY